MKSLKRILRNLDGQNKQGAPKGKHVRNWKIKAKKSERGHIFVSSQICRMSGNLQISVSARSRIDTYRCGTKINATFLQSFFSFESVNWHERVNYYAIYKNSIKGREANQKVIKDAEYLSLMKRIGDLHMIRDENNFDHNSKLFTFTFVFVALYTFYWLKFLKYFIKSKQFTSWATAFPNKEDSSKNSFN